MSLSDAARVLGVSVERVRQLVVAGDLPGHRFGNAWAVPRDAVVARRHYARRGGRPLSAVHAWNELVAGGVDLSRPGRYQRRSALVCCEMSRADADSLPRVAGALESGVNAAVALGAPLLASDNRDLYLSRDMYDRLESLVAMVVNPLGPIRLRVVDDDAWELIPRADLAPRAAVALDLLDSADPRHWIAAEALVNDG